MIHFQDPKSDIKRTKCGMDRWPSTDVVLESETLQGQVAKRSAHQAICPKCLVGKMQAGHNPENGKPQIVDEFGRILAEGASYQSFAQLFTGEDGQLMSVYQLAGGLPFHHMPMYVVAGDFWLGAFPTNIVLKVEKL